MELFYTFAKRTLSMLIRKQLDSRINFSIHVLQYVVLVEVYKENLVLQIMKLEREDLVESHKCLGNFRRS
jgi:hypothetical protein